LATSNIPPLASPVDAHKKAAVGQEDQLLPGVYEGLMKSSEPDSGGGDPSVRAAFGLPEHAVDFLNSGHQLLSLALIDVHFAGAAELCGFPESVVKVGECRQVLRLEVVGPKDQEFFLGLLCLL
jgi:hypothetical protein